MGFSRAKNRRRVDAERSADELKAAARRHGALLARLLSAVALSGALAAGGFYGFRWARATPQLALRSISFSGLERAGEADLLKLAGLSLGQNLFSVDLGAATRAMSGHPWVKEVEATRRFPSGISVRVVEHEPVAIASLGELYLVDAAGEPFKKVQVQDEVDLPLVTGIGREEYVADPKAAAARVAAALAVADAYAGSELARGAPLSEVRLEGDEVSLVTGEGQEVRMGQGEVEGKLGRLARVRSELTRRGLLAAVIHLDNRARPGWVSVQLSAPGSERREPRK